MSLTIGIDIGGTQIKGALFDANTGACLDRAMAPTRDGEVEREMPAFARGVETMVRRFEEIGAPSRLPVGISAPGLVRRDGVAIRWMPGRMKGLENLAWAEFLRRECRMLNDAQAALVGEVWQGAAQGSRDVVMLTLGTGVGGAVMSDGRVLRGHLGRAGHLGHLTVNYLGPPDIVNTPGSLEDAIGNATVARRSSGRFQMTHELAAAAKAGDAFAKELWEDSMRALAAGMASIINAFDPEVIILGGGIAAGAGDLLVEPLDRWLTAFEWRPAGQGVKVVLAQLGEWAGAYGAARFVAEVG